MIDYRVRGSINHANGMKIFEIIEKTSEIQRAGSRENGKSTRDYVKPHKEIVSSIIKAKRYIYGIR